MKISKTSTRYVAGFSSVYLTKFSLSTPDALNTVVIPIISLLAAQNIFISWLFEYFRFFPKKWVYLSSDTLLPPCGQCQHPQCSRSPWTEHNNNFYLSSYLTWNTHIIKFHIILSSHRFWSVILSLHWILICFVSSLDLSAMIARRPDLLSVTTPLKRKD